MELKQEVLRENLKLVSERLQDLLFIKAEYPRWAEQHRYKGEAAKGDDGSAGAAGSLPTPGTSTRAARSGTSSAQKGASSAQPQYLNMYICVCICV